MVEVTQLGCLPVDVCPSTSGLGVGGVVRDGDAGHEVGYTLVCADFSVASLVFEVFIVSVVAWFVAAVLCRMWVFRVIGLFHWFIVH